MLGRSDHAPYSGGYLPRYQSVAQPVVQLGVKLFVCRILTHLKARYRKRTPTTVTSVLPLFSAIISD